MRKVLFTILLASGLMCFEGFAQSNAKSIIEKMLLSIKQTNTMSYTTRLYERTNGRLGSSENNVKLTVKPFKGYLYLIAPAKGIEILYVEGENDNNALVKPNSFPYMSIYLNPKGDIMRKNQRHTILNLGFTYFADIINDAKQRVGPDFNEYFVLKGSIKWEGYDCYVIMMDFPEFAYVPYTVKEKENLLTIADKLKVGEYMIKEANPQIAHYNDVKPGQVIKVPNAYAKKTTLYVDKLTFLPVMQAMFDEKGLFEKYEFLNLNVKPAFLEEEFSRDYKDYGF